MVWYLQHCLNWTETLYLFSAFQMEVSFDDGSFQNTIQKICFPDKGNVEMIPMPHTTWYSGNQGWNVYHFLCILFQMWYQRMSFNSVFSLM